MDNLNIKNFNRKKNTVNRYVTDSDSYWREELHARVAFLHNINVILDNIISNKISDNIWGFPVTEQSVSNTRDVFRHITEDYLNFVGNRRVWVYTEVNGYWNEERISVTFANALINRLWDLGNKMLIDNYPLVSDDLKLRSGDNFIKDSLETYSDDNNKLTNNSKQATKHDIKRNKISESEDNIGSDTSNERSTSNATAIQDTFLSPQNQGVRPSSQSSRIMNRTGGFQNPDNMGVEELSHNGDPAFTTATNNNFSGETNTNEEGRTSTNKSMRNRIDENDNLEAKDDYETNAEKDSKVSSKAGNDTGHERHETLDISGVLNSFYNLFKDNLMMELDNSMYPYYLNMRIARFTDHREGRKNYD